MTTMVAAILAGGLGTRLRGQLGGRPKALVSIHGVPFLSYLLDQVNRTPVSRIVVCAGPYGDALGRSLGERPAAVPLVISHQAWPMGTGGALRNALELFNADNVLVLHGDSYIDTDLSQFAGWAGSGPFQSSLLLRWEERCPQSRAVEVNAAGKIISIGGEGDESKPAWTDSGVYSLSRGWLESLPEEMPLSLERDAFPFWVERGLGGYCVRAPFIDIGTAEGLAGAPFFFSEPRHWSRRPQALIRASRV
jgi:NDP-sugar pyrophosphorylase family protein